MKTTREEVEKKCAILEQSNKEWVDGDLSRRLSISLMLDAPMKKRGQYDYSDERITYSWPQIYFHIGRLTAARTFFDFEGNLSELECKLEDLEQKIKKEIHPNL